MKPVLSHKKLNSGAGKIICDDILRENTTPLSFMAFPVDIMMCMNAKLENDLFNALLLTYENNQQVLFEQGNIQQLVVMEKVFIRIIEPAPPKVKGQKITQHREDMREWLEREERKLKGHSSYCDKRVKRMVRKEVKDDALVMTQVRANIESAKVTWK